VDVLLGNGDGTFQASLATSTGLYGGFLTAADFNHDGKLDLAVANNNNTNVTILLGNGDGTFTAGASYAAGFQEHWSGLGAGDVNLDGKPDLVLTQGGGQAVTVMLGNGDGTFSTPVSYGTAAAPYAPVVADFNGDGKPDVAVSDPVTNAVHILLGNGDGTFQNPIDYAVGLNPEGIGVADFNGDGREDVATANYLSNDASILLGNGDGTFRAARSFWSRGTSVPAILLADFNGDGKLDVASGSGGLQFGNGDGTFQPFIGLAAGGNAGTTGGIVAADFNHDGALDLAFTTALNSGIGNQLAAVLLGNGNGTFQPEMDFGAQFLGPSSLASADFNGDGNLDLIVNGPNTNPTVALGDGTGNFKAQYVRVTGSSVPPVAGDFNRDGKQDFILSDGTNLTLSLGNGDGTFQESALTPTFSNAIDFAVADLNGDGSLDVAVVNEIVNGDGTFQPAIFFGSVFPAGTNGGGAVALAVGDVNGDGLPDVVLAQNFFSVLTYSSISVLLNQTGVTLAKSSVTFNSSLNPAASGQSISLTATVAPTGGSGTPTGTVTFLNGSKALGTVTLGGGTATWSTTGLGVGNNTITASYSGDRYFAASSSAPLVQVVNSTPFTAAPSGSASATVSAGQAAVFSVSFTPQTPQSQTVLLSCSGAPPTAICTISPSSIVLSGTTLGSATVTVQTSGSMALSVPPSPPAGYSRGSVFPSPGWFGVVLGLVVLTAFCCGGLRRIAPIGMLLAGLVLMGCGGARGSSGPVGTQPGTYTVVVTAQSGNFSQNVNLTLTVK
jgi:hypothetical protein